MCREEEHFRSKVEGPIPAPPRFFQEVGLGVVVVGELFVWEAHWKAAC